MTCRTFFRCGFIEEHGFFGDKLRQLVTIAATHILVRPAKREFGSLFMVKERGFPLHGGMAVNAVRNLPLGKLFSVDVGVAIFALRRRRPEIHVDELGF